jgi:DNA-binding helix-hairpin-helix protein with protein kinase domain
MARHLQDLQDGREYETDEVLAQLVCAQRVNEMITQLHLSDQSVDVRPSLNFWTASLDNLLADLDNRCRRNYQHKSHACE